MCNARLHSLCLYKFLQSYETLIRFFKTFILPFFDYCSSLFIYMSKTLLTRFNRFFCKCIYKLLKLNIHNLNIEEQANILANYNIRPYFYRLIERFAIFSKKIMINDILSNIKDKLQTRTNKFNVRTFDSFKVPKNITFDGKRRISVFLPKFLNKILKNSYNNSYSDLKKHFSSNMKTFYVQFMECI